MDGFEKSQNQDLLQFFPKQSNRLKQQLMDSKKGTPTSIFPY